MLNPPGAEGRAFSSAGTPSRAIQALEPCRAAGAGSQPRAHKVPGPSAPPARCGLAPNCPGSPAALWSSLGYSCGAVGGRV